MWAQTPSIHFGRDWTAHMGQVLRNHFGGAIFLLGITSALNPVRAGYIFSSPKEDDIEKTCLITTLPKEIVSHIFEQVENWSSPLTPYRICKDLGKKFLASDKHREIKRKLKKLRLIFKWEREGPSFTLKQLNEMMRFEASSCFKVEEFCHLFTYEKNLQIFKLKEFQRNKKDSLSFLKGSSCYSYLFIEAHETIIKEFPDHLIYFPDLKDTNELKAFYEVPEIVKNYVNFVWETPSIQPLLCKYYLSLNPIEYCRSVACAAYLAQDPGFSKTLSDTIKPYEFRVDNLSNIVTEIHEKSMLSKWMGRSLRSLHKYLMGLKILALANHQTAIDMLGTYQKQLPNNYNDIRKFLLEEPYQFSGRETPLEYDYFCPTSYTGDYGLGLPINIYFPTEYRIINPCIFEVPYWGAYTVDINPNASQELCIAILKSRLEKNDLEYSCFAREVCHDGWYK